MLSEFDKQAVDDMDRLSRQFASFQGANLRKQRYYDGQFLMEDLGISIPPSLKNIRAVLGWPGTVVDVLDERLDFEGWSEPYVDDVYAQNNLDVEAQMAHLDSLIYGTSFATVTAGSVGEPEVLVDVVPPTQMTAVRDPRTRVLREAVQFIGGDRDFGVPDRAVLFRPDETVWLAEDNGWYVENVDQHNLGRVQAVEFPNRLRASNRAGRSEITPAVRYYTHHALRTLVGAEVAREFYAVPQRYMMGAPESFFMDEDGNPRGAWDAMMGKILAVERDENGDVPDIGSFSAHSMDSFFNELRNVSQLLAAETSIPPTYLGFVTDNPSSADAIRMAENRLVKRAERRQTNFGKAWNEVARLALMVRDGRTFDELTADELSMRPMWRDAATPTKAAAMDQVQKGISSGVLTPGGDYTMKLLGLTPQEKKMLERDRARGLQASLMESIRQRAEQPANPEVEQLVDRREEPEQ